MITLLLPTSLSIKGIFSAAFAAALSLRDHVATGKRKEEWITNRTGSLSFKVQVHQLPSGKWTAGILTRSGTFYGNHRFGSLKKPDEVFRSYRLARRFALKLANQMANLRYAYQ
ncbi:hypothetical protein A7P61_04130 (plasmid) [Pantoea agglomerans pv. betae]|uniref:hypothetical protein n=1 Tax=Enterobacter agglomerans TaxID=549 RepID=UPI0007E5758C|nr:hypothetical protein [Pantoea agglomerans]WHU82367.1 hypothetical protein A7P61_04130 [Pantoea agglomerans pv. betae]WHU90614.1 hypothetical protein A7P62_23430 [Pantoea agglomerans pv. gypsophilae]